jgi:hypothetical protein
LVVGGHDSVVVELNRQAAKQLERCEVAVVPAATHLFEEPGALDQVTDLAAAWFTRFLPLERSAGTPPQTGSAPLPRSAPQRPPP